MSRTQKWLLNVGWLVLSVAVLVTAVVLELDNNLFSWRPAWDEGELLALPAYALIVVVSVVILRWERRHPPIAAVIGATLLVMIGLLAMLPQPLTPGTFLARDVNSPLWFRAVRLASLSLPAVVLVWRHVTRPPED